MAVPPVPPAAHRVIGLCHGVFDLFHRGHLHLLSAAAKRCDQLIVALDSDRFACELKGPGRPVEDVAVRSHKVVATGLVDLVIAVDNVAQLKVALDYYEPDLLFVGVHRRLLQRLPPVSEGVVLVPLLPGYSTTGAIKERLQ